jgi:uncharacterized repeat protein (TIGR03803 family)
MDAFASAMLVKISRLTVAGAILAMAGVAQGASLTTLYNFTGGANGANPSAAVLFGANGSLFGTTPVGGSQGFGTIFELTPGNPWAQTVLYSFQGGNDGANPGAALISGVGGVFYGTTFTGGGSGDGTVFQLTKPAKAGGAWTESVIYSFRRNASGIVNVAGTGVSLVSGSPFLTGTVWNGLPIVINGVTYTIASVVSSSALTLTASAGSQANVLYAVTDGSGPQGGVILLNGDLYGTTFGGGTAGAGTVFELVPPAGGKGFWTEKVIYNFQAGKDGSGPESGLITSNGALYGTTCCGTVGGTVFKLAPNKKGGWSKQSVYSLSAYSVGAFPFGTLAIDANGVLYGTTVAGGTGNAGIVFSLTPPTTKGKPYTLTTIHSFTNGADGGAPYGGMLLGSNGTLYATVTAGCAFGVGGVLQFTPPAGGAGAWTETVLYSFTGAQDGSQPFAGVVFGSNNMLYGTTVFSMGDTGYGTVFELTP